MAGDPVKFDLSTVFSTVAAAIPDHDFLVWRDKRFTYAEFDRPGRRCRDYLASAGLGCQTERAELAGHESGQDHIGLYLRNGNEYLEVDDRRLPGPGGALQRQLPLRRRGTRLPAHRLPGHAPWSTTRSSRPRVAAIRDRLPELRVLIQVADESGNDLLPGAVDYESIIGTEAPAGGLPDTVRR